MNRQHPRHRVHAQAAIGLAALPLLLSTASITAVESTPPTAPASGPGVTAAVEDAALSGAGGVVATSTSAVVPELKLGKVDPTDIPWAAVQSYHRAADILGHVQPSCGVSWTLLAAMGRVGSDHGRAGPSDLRDDGVAAPAVVGLPLDGKGGRAEVADTDGGALDGDTRWDRAIGPM